jgi:hypothetical protein
MIVNWYKTNNHEISHHRRTAAAFGQLGAKVEFQRVTEM